MSIQSIGRTPSQRIATSTPASVPNQFVSLHTASDAVQFGHQHAHGKTCTDHSCHEHHHDHPPKPAANNVFSKVGLWFSEFFGGMVKDLQKFGNALLRLFGGKPKPDKAHHHTHDESCKHHHH